MTVQITEKEAEKFHAECETWSRGRANTFAQAFVNNANSFTLIQDTAKIATKAVETWETTNPFPRLFPNC